MTKEEHAKVLEQTQILRDIAHHLTEDGYSMKGRDIKLAALEIEAAIMRKEPEPPTVKESLTVPVVKQSLTTEPISDAEKWKQAVMLAYGHLWHVNNEPMAPIPMRSPEKAAYAARRVLLDLLTHEERGLAINEVRALLEKAR
jgi:hypothetical protein